MSRSNCLCGILRARQRFGGRLRWWPGWNNGFEEWFDHPWGHFYLELADGTRLHYAAYDKDLAPWRQLWFSGRYTRSKPPGDSPITADP